MLKMQHLASNAKELAFLNKGGLLIINKAASRGLAGDSRRASRG
jgi:hypothetical protein